MPKAPEAPLSLAELDARHDELLTQLEALDLRIQDVLKSCQPEKRQPPLEEAGSSPVVPPIETTPPTGVAGAITSADPGVPIC